MVERKIFQILHGFCYWDATNTVQSLEKASTMFSPSIRFVSAPYYVREGWAFDDSKDGDEKFIQPVAPEGWYYDLETGSFILSDITEEFNNIVEEVEDESGESEND